MNLEERLRGALKALDDLIDQPHPELYRRSDEERLRGKREGIKLALSYLDEYVRYNEADTRFCQGMMTAQMCGDYPAPCNCDDPRTHNGH